MYMYIYKERHGAVYMAFVVIPCLCTVRHGDLGLTQHQDKGPSLTWGYPLF